MKTKAKKVLVRLLIALLLVGAVALAVRSYRALQGPPLQAWHTTKYRPLQSAVYDARFIS